MNVLQINNVTKRFGNLVAVRDVSLNVARGELCAIIGPNGAGKTTFFNLISGYFPPTSGTISFDGQDITRLATHERVRRGMARTFQITEIFPELNVFENVRIAAEVAGGYRLRPWINRAEAAEVAQHVEATLNLVALETKSDRLVGELAHGDQRAAEIDRLAREAAQAVVAAGQRTPLERDVIEHLPERDRHHREIDAAPPYDE